MEVVGVYRRKILCAEWNLCCIYCFSSNLLILLLSGFLPKVVGTEKPDSPDHSTQTGRFGSARVHVWNVVSLSPFDLGFNFFITSSQNFPMDILFRNGGWCMHDEAVVHYIDMIDQTTLGHRVIKKQFKKIPRAGWQIDPFGHSAVQAYLLGAEVH
jgi:hypothetical protein